jgi:cytochrome P450
MPYKDKDVWHPFSIGPMGCIGKNLAMMEVRLLTANILRKFDVKLADGEDGNELLYHTHDHFTLGLGKCEMVFTPRKA